MEEVACILGTDTAVAIGAAGDEAAGDRRDVDNTGRGGGSWGKGGAAVTEVVVGGDTCDNPAAAVNEDA